MSVYSWSKTAASNATADAAINWQEGQLPSTVNNSARATMAAIAAMRDDMGGLPTLGGSGNTFSLSLSQPMAAYSHGLVSFVATRANTGAVTLQIDSTGAIPLRSISGVDLVSGEIVSGRPYLVYKNPSASEWLILNASPSKSAVDAADATKLALAGGTMTGAITLAADPTSNLHATTKQYADALASARLPLAGGTMSGKITLDGDPANALHAATKQYVDARADAVIPSQSGNASKMLTTNGTSASWASVFHAEGAFTNGSATNPTANASVNIASITRAAAGTWDIAFTTPAPTANYKVSLSIGASLVAPAVTSKTASGFRVTNSVPGFGSYDFTNLDILVRI